LDAENLSKYVEDRTSIPTVLHDANVCNMAEIKIHQISQRVLPTGYPETVLWEYGNPKDKTSFYHPS